MFAERTAVGSVEELHHRDLGPEAAAWWMRPTDTALVIGSAQPSEVVDAAKVAAAGHSLVRRRSGGGAVLLTDAVWVDVVVPAGSEHWDDDVGRASWWLGEAWAAAIREASDGSLDEVEVHRGPSLRAAEGRVACFAGLGSGEVTAGGRKVVGISQRRTRASARFQCVAYLAWDPDRLLRLLDAVEGVGDALGVWASALPETVRVADHLVAALVGRRPISG